MKHPVIKVLQLLLIQCAMAVFCMAAGPEDYADSGDGSQANPFEIWTAEHLHQLHERPEDFNKHFTLMADIDMDPALPGNRVYDTAVIAPHNGSGIAFAGTSFTGFFYGNGYAIHNLTIVSNTAVSHDDFKGLFGRISGSGAEITQLGLIDVVVGGRNDIGGLVGENAGGMILNCFSAGAITGRNNVGGLVGTIVASGRLSGSFSSSSVTAASTVGGLVGFNSHGVISDCHAAGPVSGNYMVGGFVGQNRHSNEGRIVNSYSTGSITSSGGYVGGFVGSSLGTIEQCFWDVEASGWGTAGEVHRSALGLETVDMQNLTTFLHAGWDFLVETANGTNDVWAMPASGYPVLAWQDVPLATMESFQFTFNLGEHGSRSGGGGLTQVLLEGQRVVLPVLDIATGWIFTGWDDSYENDTEDRTITAQYVSIAGDGSPGNPYQVSTREHLEGLNQRLSAHYVLVNDIDLDPDLPGNRVYTAAVIAPRDGRPTSFPGSQFSGTFNGNRHVIRNLTIARNESEGGDDRKGLFSAVAGNVRALGLEQVSVEGGSHVGGLAGFLAKGATISDCYASGMVEGHSYVGGLLGYVSEGAVSGSYSAGSVLVRSNYSGGLVGYSYKGNLRRCYSTASVIGTGAYMGGLVGVIRGGIVNTCFSIGLVSSSEEYFFLAGGLVGLNDGGTVDRSFWDRDTSGRLRSSGGTAKSTIRMQMISTFTDADWDFVLETANGINDIWALSPSGYPALAWQHDAVLPTVSHEVIFDLGEYGTRTGGGALVQIVFEGQALVRPHFTVSAGRYFIGWDRNPSDIAEDCTIAAVYGVLAGDGSEEHPFQISTRQHLEAVNHALGAHYILVADIDLDPALAGNHAYLAAVIAPHDGTRLAFRGTPFTGSFDGNHHIINNLVILADASASYDNFKGLFGCLDGNQARIVNLNLHATRVAGDWYVGGLVGQVLDGTIADCSTVGVADGTGYYVGGLVGHNSGLIDRCTSGGQVVSSVFSGGLVGRNSGRIQASGSTVSLSARDSSGGLVGSQVGGSIANCYAAGSVTGRNYVGGLVGNCNGGSIVNTYSIAAVSASGSNVGGLLGFSSSAAGSVSNSFWDVDVSGVGTNGAVNFGAIGKPTPTMMEQSLFTDVGWDFVGDSINGTEDIWVMPSGSYPQLSGLETFTVTFDLGTHATRAGGGGLEQAVFRNQGALLPELNVEGGWYFVEWAGDYRSVDGDRIIMARYVAMAGDGSSANPYQISIRQHLEAINHDLTAHYVLINDLDLAPDLPGNRIYERAVVAPYEGAASGFTGTFDGGGHIIRNLSISTLLSDSKDYVALFGYVNGTNALISDVGLQNVNIVGRWAVGGLVGAIERGTVRNSYSTGTVRGANTYVGGLVGRSKGFILNSYSACVVSGRDYVGGFVGGDEGSIFACYSTGEVDGNGASTGGFSGSSRNVQWCFWDKGTSMISTSPGGLGRSTRQMQSLQTFAAWIDGSWTINDQHDYPRLAWEGHAGIPVTEDLFGHYRDHGAGTLDNPYILGNPFHFYQLTQQHDDWGKAFALQGDLDMGGIDLPPISTFSGQLDGKGWSLHGITIVSEDPETALIGTLQAGGRVENLTIRDAMVRNSTTRDSIGYRVAVLCARNYGTVRQVHVVSSSVAGTAYVALLVADNYGLISVCSAIGTVRQRNNYDGDTYVGAVAGRANVGSVIEDCMADVTIDCAENSGRMQRVGGLVGYNQGTIRASSAVGRIWAGDNRGIAYVDAPPGVPGPLVRRTGIQRVGGLCGHNTGSITDSYARVEVVVGANRGDSVTTTTGTFRAGANQYAAGFCGYNNGTVQRGYSTGGVTTGGSFPRGDQVLIREVCGFAFSGVVSGSFWDTLTSGIEHDASGAAGKSTADMQGQSTFVTAGWDFFNLWRMDGYPVLGMAGTGISFEAWAAGCPEGFRGPMDNSAGDNIFNLTKYAFGLSPLDSHTTSDLFQLSVDETGAYLIMRYRKSKAAIDVNVLPEASCSLLSPDWNREMIELEKIGEDATHENWEARLPLSERCGFVRMGFKLLP